MDEQCRITAIIDDQIRTRAVRPGKGLFGAPPILLQRLAFPGKYRRRLRLGYRRGGMILSGEDIARSPAEIGTEVLERFDQHGRLNGHVETARDFQTPAGVFSGHISRERPSGRAFRFRRVASPPDPRSQGSDRRCGTEDSYPASEISWLFLLKAVRAFCHTSLWSFSRYGRQSIGSRFRTGVNEMLWGVTMPAEMIRVKASSTVMLTSISSSLGIMTKTPVVGVRAQGM